MIKKPSTLTVNRLHKVEHALSFLSDAIINFDILSELDVRDCLPSVQSLLSCEQLGELRHSASFKYLVQVGYEHIQSVVQCV